MELTATAKFQFGRRLGALLIVAYETLVHSLVFAAHGVDAQHGLGVTERRAVLHPRDALDRIALRLARQRRRASVVDRLHLRLDIGR